MKNDSDQVLIGRAQDGDAQAFARLIERHYSTIYRVAYKWSGDRYDAEDVAQDVSIKLAQAIKSFEGRATLSSWIYRVTVNAVRDLQRAGKRRPERGEELTTANEPSHSPDPLEDMARAQLWQAVRKLEPKQCDAILLTFGEEMSHKQAAEIMKCAESTVSWYVHEARKNLKHIMQGD